MCTRWLVLLGLLLAAPVGATTYFVDPVAGSNANNGTSAGTPWKNPPGTRNTGNTGFISATWGSVGTGAKIQAGDTILLKGGTTYSTGTVTNAGAWLINSSYYVTTASAASPITITVAAVGQWSGSTSHFTFNGTGIEGTSPYSNQISTSRPLGNDAGPCASNGTCGMIDIEGVPGVIFGGISATQKFFLSNVRKSGGATSGIQLVGSPVTMTQVQIGWLDITGKTAYDIGPAIGVGFVNNSWIHDVLIHEWDGSGANVGYETGFIRARGVIFEDITVLNTGNRATSAATEGSVADPLRFGGAEYNDSLAGGGVWCLRCVSGNSYSSATNSFGCLSGGEDGMLRYRDSAFYGSARNTVLGASVYGFDAAGDGADCPNGTGDNLPTQTVMVIRSVMYNNRVFSEYPHNGGSMYIWNSTLVRESLALATQNAEHIELYNSIIDPLSRGITPLVWHSAGGISSFQNRVAPRVRNTLIRGATLGSQLSNFTTECTTDNGSSWTGIPCTNGSCASGTCRQHNTGSSGSTFSAPLGALVGNGNIVGTQSSQFTSTGGQCDTAWSSGSGAPGFADCNFTLGASSPAIDPATPLFPLLANGAGTASTTLTVKASTTEPEQLSQIPPWTSVGNPQGGSGGFNYGTRPHIADPRTYFVNPGLIPWTRQDEVIQIAGATCPNGVANYGSAERVKATAMTATTITLAAPGCTWANNAGVGWPYNGTALDMGAFETAGSGSTSTASTSSTTSTVTTTVTTSTGAGTTTTTNPPGMYR